MYPICVLYQIDFFVCAFEAKGIPVSGKNEFSQHLRMANFIIQDRATARISLVWRPYLPCPNHNTGGVWQNVNAYTRKCFNIETTNKSFPYLSPHVTG